MSFKRWRADTAAWVASLNFSVSTAVLVALVLVGGIAISPNVSTFIAQRREIAQLRSAVKQHRENVEQIESARARWKDPAYVRAQARNRLSYVLPGETQLSIINDVILPLESDDKTNSELIAVQRNWGKDLLVSLIAAGNALEDK